jgi:hypothetical protein
MKILFLVIFLFSGFVFHAQVEQLQASFCKEGSLSLKTNKGNYVIHYFNDKAIETSFSSGEFFDTTVSHAIIEKTQFVRLKSTRNDKHSLTFSLHSKKIGLINSRLQRFIYIYI